MKNADFYIFLKWFFLVGLFVLPFVYWPWANVAYEVPKTQAFSVWSGLVVILGALGVFVHAPKRGVDLRLVVLVLVFTAIAIVASVFGVDPLKSLVGNYYRGDGLVTLLGLVGLFFFLVLYWEDTWRDQLTKVLSISTLVLASWVVLQGFRYHFLSDYSASNWSGPVGIVFGQPNFLAGYLVVTLPFLDKFAKSLKRDGASFLIVIHHLAVIFTFSWGGVATLFIYWMVRYLVYKEKNIKVFASLLIFFAVLSSLIYILQFRRPGFVGESRERIVVKTLLGVRERPIFGYGWANVDYAFEAVDWPIKLNDDIYLDKAHSNILEVLATTGIVGLSVYLSILGYSLYKSYSLGKKDSWWNVILLTLVVYVAHSQMNVTSVSEEIVFWVMLGMVASIYEDRSNSV